MRVGFGVPLALLLLHATAYAIPSDNAFIDLPQRFQTEELTAGSRGLGEICLSRDEMPDGSTCNPAFLPEQKESSLLVRVFIGNGYTAFSEANTIVNQSLSKEFLEGLFQGDNVTSLEANTELLFTTKYFSASYSPYRVQFLSELQNPNLPVVDIQAVVQQTLTLSGGMPLTSVSPTLKDVTVGMSIQALDRKYVDGSFSLFDVQALTGDGGSLLPVQDQKALLINPAIGWVPEGWAWKPRFSFQVVNLGVSWPSTPLFPNSTDLAFGVGIEPPMPVGRLRLGLDTVNLFTANGLADRLRFGTSYQFGIMEGMLGVNSSAATAGLEFIFQILQLGIVYEFSRSDFGDSSVGNSIATEAAIRL